MADLLVDGAINEIPEWYDGNYSRSELVEGAYAATGLFPSSAKAESGYISRRPS